MQLEVQWLRIGEYKVLWIPELRNLNFISNVFENRVRFLEEVTHMHLFIECVLSVQIPLFLVDAFIVYNSFLKYETERKIPGNCRVNIRMYQQVWRPQYSSTASRGTRACNSWLSGGRGLGSLHKRNTALPLPSICRVRIKWSVFCTL